MIRATACLTATLAAVAGVLSANDDRPAAVPAVAHATTAPEPTGDGAAVAPGLVKWHATSAAAEAAATRSGRPVLVFHMMGRLDRQFC